MKFFHPLIFGLLLGLLAIALPWTASESRAESFCVELLEPVANNQSYDQVLRYSVQKASRRALEKAGTYITSRTDVVNGELSSDEISSMTAGIVKVELLESSQVIHNNMLHAKVKVRVDLDPRDVERRIEQLQQDRRRLEELKREQARVRELEGSLQALIREQHASNAQASNERLRIRTELDAALHELEVLRARQASLLPSQGGGGVSAGRVRLIKPVPGGTPGLPAPEKVE